MYLLHLISSVCACVRVPFSLWVFVFLTYCLPVCVSVCVSICVSIRLSFTRQSPSPNSPFRHIYFSFNVISCQVNCGRVALEDCGVCGDPLSQNPGDNTLGGRYGSGIIVETYKEGDVSTLCETYNQFIL